jgi:hypothetical protein
MFGGVTTSGFVLVIGALLLYTFTFPIRFVDGKFDTATVAVPTDTARGLVAEITLPLLVLTKYTPPIVLEPTISDALTGITVLLEVCIFTVPITFDAVGSVKLTGTVIATEFKDTVNGLPDEIALPPLYIFTAPIRFVDGKLDTFTVVVLRLTESGAAEVMGAPAFHTFTAPIRFVDGKLDTFTVAVLSDTARGFAVEIILPLLVLVKYTPPTVFEPGGNCCSKCTCTALSGGLFIVTADAIVTPLGTVTVSAVPAVSETGSGFPIEMS